MLVVSARRRATSAPAVSAVGAQSSPPGGGRHCAPPWVRWAPAARLPAMRVQATTATPYATDADTVVVGVFEGERVEQDFGGGTLQSLLDRGEARATFKHLALAHEDSRRVLLVGLGPRAEFDPERARAAAAGALCWQVPSGFGEEVAAGLVQGTLLHAYRFERYRPASDEKRVERLLIAAPERLEQTVREAAILAEAQNRARALGDTPANDL